jgi:hypothetical protein
MNRNIFTLRGLVSLIVAPVLIVSAGNAATDDCNSVWLAPPMACNDLVHISLDTTCHATIGPHTVLQEVIGSPTDYRIKLYYANGTEQADLSLDNSDINGKYDYKIWHLPSGNSCWGKILVEDKYPPEIQCSNYRVRCGMDLNPRILGFPIPAQFIVKIDSIEAKKYEVTGWDACGLVYLEYRDYLYNNQCDSLCFNKIIRVWTAKDEQGNASTCADTICVVRPDETDIVYPPHFDDFQRPFIRCTIDFPKLANGNPSPEFTGWPVPKGCSTLTASYTDLKILTCGNMFKLIRRWVILNWCTGVLTEYNQIIKVADDIAPVFACPKEFTVGMKLYECRSYGKLPAPDSVYDCNSWKYEIFSMTQDPHTGLPHLKGKQYISYNTQDKCFYLDGAPEGRIWLVYQLTDDCGNVSECTVEAGVIDDLAPIPVCIQKTVVALGADGTAKVYAESFDNFSIDNCGVDGFKARRMEDTCQSGTDKFGPFVSFCCADIGHVVMVALEVSDAYGNKNTCMVEVTVQDKEPPVVIPPTDITVACDFPIDWNNLNAFGAIRLKESDRKNIIIADPFYASKNYIAGRDGLVTDNCEVRFIEEVEKNIQCNSGQIYRIFTATDKQGLKSSGVQTITIINTDPFDSTDISWPLSLEINSCNNVKTHPDQTGYPVYRNKTCAQIAANYYDTRLTVLDSTCFKILRKWIVIDWCQYDQSTGKGYWEHTQIIAVKSSEPPTISSCGNLEICDQNAFKNITTGQCMASFQLKAEGKDDCTETHNLIWNYRIDENNTGVFGPVQNGDVAAGVLPVGTHRLRWILTDQCGNVSTCDRIFTLKDCKKPTPYCFNGIVTVVMPGTGNITVWAKDFNLGSFDNCTANNDLKFSFSPNTNDVSVTYNCDSLNRQKTAIKVVRIYVTDEYGNQDYCETTIRIQDNNNVCPGTDPGFSLSGKTNRENKDALPGTSVSILDSGGNLIDQQTTDNQCQYAFTNLNASNFYVKANRNDDITNGVSTLDIVLIQRHILGLKTFSSPYKYLAADVNNSKSVTAKDISDIRKVILGVTRDFPNQTPIWKFIKADHQFANPDQPWDAPAIIESTQLQDILDQVNFMGIKSGDIDQSATVNLKAPVDSRSEANYYWVLSNARVVSDQIIEVDVICNSDMEIDGFQMGLEIADLRNKIIDIKSSSLELTKDEYVVSDKFIKVSSVQQTALSLVKNQVLFTIILHTDQFNKNIGNALNALSEFSSEVYIEEKKQNLVFRNENHSVAQKNLLTAFPIQPNPFSKDASLRFELPEPGNVNLHVYDISGKKILTIDYYCSQGKNEIRLRRQDLKIDGLLYYVLITPFGTVSEKMIVTE